MYGTGISREGSILDVSVDFGIVKKSGAWYTYEGEQLGQGRENAKQFLRSTPEMMIELDQRVREMVLAKTEPPVTSDEEELDVEEIDEDAPISLG
jgi:recombination protein RecA